MLLSWSALADSLGPLVPSGARAGQPCSWNGCHTARVQSAPVVSAISHLAASVRIVPGAGASISAADVPAAQRGALDIQSAKEQFQRAYVGAIAAAAGCTAAKPDPDSDGIDLTLRQEISASEPYESSIDVQLKATARADALDDLHLKVRLSRKGYDRLRTTRISYPRILIAMALPPDDTPWHEQTEECLRLMRCAYWMSLKGEPGIDTKTRTVSVPRQNVFDVDALCQLMYEVRAGQGLGS